VYTVRFGEVNIKEAGERGIDVGCELAHQFLVESFDRAVIARN
jgi:hypothetical protein